MEQFPDDYKCDGQIDIWEWMEEKETQSMTREEAIKVIKSWTPIFLQMGGKCTNETKEAQYMAIEALESLPSIRPKPSISEIPNKWIPVSERLPEENKTVIASTKYDVYPETKYTKEYGWEWAYEAGADYWEELEDVIAWMPLPEPYKAESED